MCFRIYSNHVALVDDLDVRPLPESPITKMSIPQCASERAAGRLSEESAARVGIPTAPAQTD